jgi:hypothetical protein
VDAFRSNRRVPGGDGQGINAVDGRLVVPALRQPDRLSAQDVDGGNYDYR